MVYNFDLTAPKVGAMTSRNKLPTKSDLKSIHRELCSYFGEENMVLIGSAAKCLITGADLQVHRPTYAEALNDSPLLTKLDEKLEDRTELFLRGAKDLDYAVPNAVFAALVSNPDTYGLTLIKLNEKRTTAVFITKSGVELDICSGDIIDFSIPLKASFFFEQSQPEYIDDSESPGGQLAVYTVPAYLQVLLKWGTWMEKGMKRGIKDAYDAVYIIDTFYGSIRAFLIEEGANLIHYMTETGLSVEHLKRGFGFMSMAAESSIEWTRDLIRQSKIEYEAKPEWSRMHNPRISPKDLEAIEQFMMEMIAKRATVDEDELRQRTYLRGLNANAENLFKSMSDL